MGVILPIFVVADRSIVVRQHTQTVTIAASGEDKKRTIPQGLKPPARQEKEGRS
jgi:hypothetical protein